MKRETLTHPKTAKLAAAMGVDRPTVLGWLTLLWDYTGVHTPRGDIGRWDNAVIASALDYRGDPDELIGALVTATWLDKNDEHRLIVHDWPDHCEWWVRRKLRRAGQWFLECYGCPDDDAPAPDQGSASGAPAAHQGGALIDPRARSKPIQTNPNQSKPRSIDRSKDIDHANIDWKIVLAEAQRHQEKLRLNLKNVRNRQLLIKACVLVRYGPMPESWLADAIEAVLQREPKRPAAYLTQCLKRSAVEAGKPFAELMAAVKVPEKALETKRKGGASD